MDIVNNLNAAATSWFTVKEDHLTLRTGRIKRVFFGLTKCIVM